MSRRAELERAVALYPGQRAKIAGQVAAELAVVAVGDESLTAREIGGTAVRIADEVLLALAARPACGVARVNGSGLAYACRLSPGHDGDHHPNPCGHDGCTGLECIRGAPAALGACDGAHKDAQRGPHPRSPLCVAWRPE